MATKLKAVVDDINTVDEQFRDLYEKQNDGKYKLAAEGVEDVSGLKSALGREKEARRKARETLEVIGLDEEADPEEIKRLLEAGREALEKGTQQEDKAERVKQQLQKTHQKELEKRDTTIRELSAQVEKLLVDNIARTALIDAKGNVKIMLPHVKAVTKVVRLENGEYVPRVYDEDGETERVGKGGDPMTVEELVAEFRATPDFSDAFEGSGASGSGAPTESGGGASPPSRKAGATKQGITQAKRASGEYAL